MSDHGDQTPGRLDDPAFDDPAFDDPAFDELRALLADARATEPVPADVAARLDATLEALQEERRAEASVVPMRRRRAAARFLVAAAAVVVVGAGGVGIAQLGGSGGTPSADKASSGSAADSLTTSPSAPEAATGLTPAAPQATSPGTKAPPTTHLPRFSTTRFPQQAAAFEPATTDSLSNQDSARSPSSDAPTTTAGRAGEACPGPTIAGSTSYPILLDGQSAVLVLHEVVDGTQEVDAWSCDGATELATTTVAR